MRRFFKTYVVMLALLLGGVIGWLVFLGTVQVQLPDGLPLDGPWITIWGVLGGIQFLAAIVGAIAGSSRRIGGGMGFLLGLILPVLGLLIVGMAGAKPVSARPI